MSCLVCQSRAELFLCNPHLTDLRANLVALAVGPEVNGHPTPGLLDALADVVLKQTRLGTGGGHRKRGDELPAPFEPDTVRGRLTRQGEATVLMDDVVNILGTIVRGLCEDRGLEPPALGGDGAAIAKWLARNAHAIAMSEDAGQTWTEVDSLKRRVERLVDRPVGRKYLGPCPTWLEDERRACKTELWAPADAIEKRCPSCRQTHNCNRLQLLLVNDLERSKVTIGRILELNRVLPEDYRIPERTLRRWRKPGPRGEPPKLRPREYVRPCSCGHRYGEHRDDKCRKCDCVAFDGRRVITRHSDDDEPLYLWSDVRKMRAAER